MPGVVLYVHPLTPQFLLCTLLHIYMPVVTRELKGIESASLDDLLPSSRQIRLDVLSIIYKKIPNK